MPVSPEPAAADNLGSPILLPRRGSKPPKTRRKLTPRFTQREEHFISAILKGVDRVTATIQAGYSVKNAAVTAYKLSRHPKIKAAIAERAEAIARAGQIDAQYVVDSIKAEIEYLKQNPERSAAASQAIFRGTELLGKTIALFRDRVEEDRQITVTIQRVG